MEGLRGSGITFIFERPLRHILFHTRYLGKEVRRQSHTTGARPRYQKKSKPHTKSSHPLHNFKQGGIYPFSDDRVPSTCPPIYGVIGCGSPITLIKHFSLDCTFVGWRIRRARCALEYICPIVLEPLACLSSLCVTSQTPFRSRALSRSRTRSNFLSRS